MKIVIPGEFTTLNDYIEAERGHRQQAATIKRYETRRVYLETRQYAPITSYPVMVEFHWYRRDRRTDPDNVVFARKFILDGLQQSGVLKNDGWNQINAFRDFMKLDPDNPRVEIDILEEIK